MKRRFIAAMLLALAIVLVLAGCDGSAARYKIPVTKSVILTIDSGSTKGVSPVTVNGNGYMTGLTVASFQYKATCPANPEAPGTVKEWTKLKVFTDDNMDTELAPTSSGASGFAKIEGLTSGTWLIEIRALNKNNGVVLYGNSGSFVITKSGQNCSITLSNDIGTNYYSGETPANVPVAVGVTIPSLDGNVEVKYAKFSTAAEMLTVAAGLQDADPTISDSNLTKKENAATTVASDGISITTDEVQGKKAYYRNSNSMEPGLYVMQIRYYVMVGSEPQVKTYKAGHTFQFRVTESTPFAINGTLKSGEWHDLNIDPITVDSPLLALSVNVAPKVVSIDETYSIRSTIKVDTKNIEDISYAWFLDGEYIAGQDSSTFNYSGLSAEEIVEMSGDHVLSVIVAGTLHGETVAGYLSQEFSINDAE